MTSKDDDELNRLVHRGQPRSTAMDADTGKLIKEFEVTQAEISQKADDWCRGIESIPPSLMPTWDYDPDHIYLAYDSSDPEQCDASDYVRVERMPFYVLKSEIDQVRKLLPDATLCWVGAEAS